MSFHSSIALQGVLEKPVHLALQGFLLGDIPVPMVVGAVAQANQAFIGSVTGDFYATLMVIGSPGWAQVESDAVQLSVGESAIFAASLPSNVVVRNTLPSNVFVIAE
jgi:hypothetical protein